jgi:hypothetical protein
MYRVMWRDIDGKSNHGEYCLSLEEGQAWIDYLRKKHPDMKHWLQRV